MKMSSNQIGLWSLIAAAVALPIALVQVYQSSRDSEGAPDANMIATTNAAQANIDCSSLGTQGGNVSIRCDRNVNIAVPQSNRPFVRFEGTIDREGIETFYRFVSDHSNKIVRLTLRVEDPDTPKFARFLPSESDRNMSITYYDQCTSSVSCSGEMGIDYYFNIADGGAIFPCNAGAWCVEGYFSIEPTQGIHQGIVSVGIMGISDSEARLSDPDAR